MSEFSLTTRRKVKKSDVKVWLLFSPGWKRHRDANSKGSLKIQVIGEALKYGNSKSKSKSQKDHFESRLQSLFANPHPKILHTKAANTETAARLSFVTD